MFIRLGLILLLVLPSLPLHAELNREDITDLTRFYLFCAAETSSTQIVNIACSGEDASLTPALAARVGNVWIDSGIGYDIFAIDRVQIWWRGQESYTLEPSDRDNMTSVVLTNFVGDSRWIGLLENAPSDHPVVRNRNVFAAALALRPDSFVLQDIQAGDATLQQLHALYPERPRPLGLYVTYRNVGTAH